ncbi:MAG TPA: small multi-drug export protein [Methanomicrobiales archaeon]|nr:small multi-drug export protein [Methanomicrobiales archaeon]
MLPETGWIRGVDADLVAIPVLLLVLPLVIGLVGGLSIPAILGFIVSILLLQGLAPPAGIALGLPVYLLIPFLVSVAAGAILLIYRVCDIFSEKSAWLKSKIAKVKELMDKHPALHSYGEVALIALMWVPGLGLYGTPILAWILNWRGPRAVLLMLTGWLIACLVVLGTAEGILTLLF